jgi:hypothetical protein
VPPSLGELERRPRMPRTCMTRPAQARLQPVNWSSADLVADEVQFSADLYQGAAAAYDRHRLPYPAAMTADLIRRAGVCGQWCQARRRLPLRRATSNWPLSGMRSTGCTGIWPPAGSSAGSSQVATSRCAGLRSPGMASTAGSRLSVPSWTGGKRRPVRRAGSRLAGRKRGRAGQPRPPQRRWHFHRDRELRLRARQKAIAAPA